MVGSARATWAAAWCLAWGLAWPRPLAAQSASPDGDLRPFAWVLAGVDLQVRERWRGVVRVGRLGDSQSRLALGELAFQAHPALQLLLGHVHIAPVAPHVPRTSLSRGGVTWLPVRGRLTVDDRLLIEQRATGAAAALRGRNRLRVSGSRPGGLPFVVFASVEVIAAEPGLVEARLQAGGLQTVGPLSVECYWLQRRLRGGAVGTGVGLTASWRIAD
jgi:hypothetical protein